MICAVIPTYNNADTIGEVIRGTAKYISDIIVVVDGSTDLTRQVIQSTGIRLTLIDYEQNHGKGYALKQGLKKAIEMGFTHALTIDSDGQHLTAEIPKLLQQMHRQPKAFIIGSRNLKQQNMPRQNTFANRFSNFWFALQTLHYLPDTQTGMRIYPLQRLHGLRYMTARYEAELELLVFAAWAREKLISVPIDVYYPPRDKRVSHFRPAKDFTRISILNTVLCILAIIYGYPRMILGRLFVRNCCTMLLLLLCCSVSAQMPKRLTAFPATEGKNNHTAVIVCAGGSYSWHDRQTEGTDVARWLQSEGCNAFVCNYRVATASAYFIGFRLLGLGNSYPDMLTDILEALEFVYKHASQYDIDTTKIGVMGFSAGGHLTMMSFTHNQTRYKPHFLCPIYPVVTMSDKRYAHHRSRRGALGPYRMYRQQMRDSLSIEKHITTDCPPVFLMNCKDDPIVKYQNSILLDSALNANNVPHRYLQYSVGGHGFGADSTKAGKEAIQWKQEFINWLNNL